MACSQTGAASTLEVQENGEDDTRLGGAAWVEDDNFDTASAADEDKEPVDGSSKRRKQHKPANSGGGRNKLFDLLNDLEGGGGGGLEALDLLDLGGGVAGESSSSSSTVLLGGGHQQHGETVADPLPIGDHEQQQEDGEGAEVEGQEDGEVALSLEPVKRTARRKYLSRMPPLTRSQAEEWRCVCKGCVLYARAGTQVSSFGMHMLMILRTVFALPVPMEQK